MQTADIKPTVLIYMQNENTCKTCVKLLEHSKYTVRETSSVESILNFFFKELIHIAIIDFDTQDNFAENQLIITIEQISIRFPSCYIIIITDKPIEEAINVLRIMRTFSRSGKPIVSGCYFLQLDDKKDLVKSVHSIFHNSIRINYSLKFIFENFEKNFFTVYSENFKPSDSPIKLSSDLLSSEFKNILGRIFHGNNGVETLKISNIRGGRSIASGDTITLEITPIVSNNRETRPVVFKFGDYRKIETESDNFDRFVQWYVRFSHSVQKINYYRSNNTAGIIYTFAGDREKERQLRMMTLSHFARKNSSMSTCNIIDRMFGKERLDAWYSITEAEKLSTTNEPLEDYYTRWMKGNHRNDFKKTIEPKILRKISDCKIKKEKTKEYVTFRNEFNEELNLRNPIDFYMTTHPDLPETKTCICHGDLHANNILIDMESHHRPNWYLIDYYYTGIGHIFKDFAELEVSMRYDLFWSSKLDKPLTLSKFMVVEKSLSKYDCFIVSPDIKKREPSDDNDEESDNKCKRIIKVIRENAKQMTQNDHKIPFAHKLVEEYYWALFFVTMKRLLYAYSDSTLIGYFALASIISDKLEELRT